MLLTKGERGAGVFERGVWDGLGAGDKSVRMSVGGEKVQTKNETATDFRL